MREREREHTYDLHLKVIQLKEASESLEASLKHKAKLAVAEKSDLAFLS